MNIAVATAVSREGKRRYFSKIIPVPASTQLLAKLAMGLSVDMATVILTAITVCVLLPSLWMQIALAAIAAIPFALLSSTFGLLLDVYFPRLDWKTETEAVKRNLNGVYGMFGTMALQALLVAGFFGLLALGLSEIWSILLILVLLILVDVLLVKWLLGKASKVYLLQEKFA
jgi:ABC-2 type transport system permease protein